MQIPKSYKKPRYSLSAASEILGVSRNLLGKWLNRFGDVKISDDDYSDSSKREVITYSDFLECKLLANVRRFVSSSSKFYKILDNFRKVHDDSNSSGNIPFYLLFKDLKIIKDDVIMTSVSSEKYDFSIAVDYLNSHRFFPFMFDQDKLREVYRGIYYDESEVLVKPLDEICPDISVDPRYNFGAPSFDGTRIASSPLYDSYIFYRCDNSPLADTSLNKLSERSELYEKIKSSLDKSLISYVADEYALDEKHIFPCVIFEDLIKHRKHYGL